MHTTHLLCSLGCGREYQERQKSALSKHQRTCYKNPDHEINRKSRAERARYHRQKLAARLAQEHSRQYRSDLPEVSLKNHYVSTDEDEYER